MEPKGQFAVVVFENPLLLLGDGLVAKLINEGLLFACVVAFVLITIAGLFG